MKLFYSPSFAGECYRILPEGETRFEKIVGDAGLLDFLELSLGLPGGDRDPISRILAYRDSLESVSKGAFFEDAFTNDSLATAKEILRWRDLLVMEGFDPGKDYKSVRLRTLAEAEKSFSFPGVPERWKKVLARLREGWKIDGVEIIVHHAIGLLPKLIREALSALSVVNGQYDELDDKDRDIPVDLSGKQIAIWNFGTVAEAYRWGAGLSSSADMAVICPDPLRLNAALRNSGSSLIESSTAGDSSITQFLRLGLSLLERPVNIKNLLEFLRIGFSPIPAKTRSALARALKGEGGRGERWRETLSSLDDVSEVKDYLEPLLDDDTVNGGMVASSTVTDWCGKVASWASSMETTPRKKAYLMNLKGLCDGLCNVIGREECVEVEVDFVMKTIKTLYEPMPVGVDKAQTDSMIVLGSHRCFIDYPDRLLWIPCNGGLETPYPYSFLLQEEAGELGVRTMTDYVRYDFNLMVSLLGKVKKIDLCSCDFDCGEALKEHPAVTLCKDSARIEDKHVISSTTSLFTPMRTAEIGVDLFPKQNKGAEEKDLYLSATSMETLFGYPFDFVMEKTLGFQDVSSLQLSNLVLVQGTVAHYVFEQMVNDSGGNIVKLRSMLGAPFTERVEKAAQEKGEILLLPENKTFFFNFKETLCKSIRVLLDILEESKLTPISCEESLDENLPGIGQIIGSVDFYAETKYKDIVIIDFKYSTGSHYITKLKNDSSVQLEVYSEGLQKKLHGRKVVDRGYYFFPINQLHTYNESGIFKGSNVVSYTRPGKDFTLEERIRNSVAFRKEQLKAGTLEMEEGAPLEEIEYHKASAGGRLIDLPKDSKVKASSPFAKPTKYPILKNAIK